MRRGEAGSPQRSFRNSSLFERSLWFRLVSTDSRFWLTEYRMQLVAKPILPPLRFFYTLAPISYAGKLTFCTIRAPRPFPFRVPLIATRPSNDIAAYISALKPLIGLRALHQSTDYQAFTRLLPYSSFTFSCYDPSFVFCVPKNILRYNRLVRIGGLISEFIYGDFL